MVALDRLRVEQALGNLVENSLRYGSGVIRLTAVEGDRALELHVTDDGPGFPIEFLPHAFERFSRAEQSRAGGGAGLGLAIVAAVAEAHLGAARAANTPGGGADVSLAIPIASGPSTPQLPDTAHVTPGRTEAPTPAPRSTALVAPPTRSAQRRAPGVG